MTDFKDLTILGKKNCYSRALSQSFVIWRVLQNILFLKLWKSTSMTTYGCGKNSSLLSRSRKSNVLVSFPSLYETSDFALHPPNHLFESLLQNVFSPMILFTKTHFFLTFFANSFVF